MYRGNAWVDIDEGEAGESLLKTCKCGNLSKQASTYHKPWRNTMLVISIINVVLLVISSSLLLIHGRRNFLPNAGLRASSTYSPLFDMVDLDLRPKKMNATVFPAKHGASVARELPNPVAEQVWDRWEEIVWLPITRHDILRMGKDPSTVVKLEHAVWGLGDDAYLADYSMSHQIHCLNSLRKTAYATYYNTTAGDSRKMGMKELHINHCVDILLQSIQCSGDANLITYHWLAGQDVPEPDMSLPMPKQFNSIDKLTVVLTRSINKECIDFDKFTTFRYDHGLDKHKFEMTMKKSLQTNVKELHQSDAYYEYAHERNPNHVNGANPGDDFNL